MDQRSSTNAQTLLLMIVGRNSVGTPASKLLSSRLLYGGDGKSNHLLVYQAWAKIGDGCQLVHLAWGAADKLKSGAIHRMHGGLRKLCRYSLPAITDTAHDRYSSITMSFRELLPGLMSCQSVLVGCAEASRSAATQSELAIG